MQLSNVPTTLYVLASGDPQIAWVVGDSGPVLHTVDRGLSWSGQYARTNYHLFGLGAMNSQVAWISSDNGTILGTKNGGNPIVVFALKFPRESTSLPRISLDQNYPNPFNPQTQISYEQPSAGFITLKIYNLLGAQIHTLVNQREETGQHTVSFDGSLPPSRVYFYRLQKGNHVETRKMILLR